MKIELISKYFEQDHDRLDNLFQEYTRLKNDDFPRAKESFLQFELGLRRHIVWEEDILFPLFEKKTGMFEHGPTSVMKLEHREIHGILDAMRQKIMNGQSGTGKEEEELLLTLGNQNLKEESVL